MKKFFSVFAVWVLLLSNSNLLLAYESSTDDTVTQRFINVWENEITSEMNENWFYFDTNGDAQVCDQNNIRWCVRYAKRQEAWDFYPDGATLDSIPKNVQIRKMVLPTNKTWEFNIQLMVRGKESITSTSSNAKICSVVVFDKSNTMLTFSSSSNQYEPWDKWYKAASWAIEYSDVLLDSNVFSKVWLVFFWTTWSVVQDLTGERFEDSDFNITRGDARTDIDFGLLKAGEMLNSSSDYCDKKYIVLMTDWDANAYMSWWLYWEEKTNFTDTTIPVAETIKDANILKESWIEIFTIWYQVPSSAETTLLNIATDSWHFLKADSDNIIDKFRKTLYSQINYPYTKLVSIKDSLWEKIALDNWDDDINITEEVNITSSWIVYSFPIRIDPTASWWVNTNSWLVMNYLNAEWNPDSLVIPAEMTSRIYWKQPECGWSYPSGNWVLTWKWEFTQIWTWGNWAWGQNESGPKGSEDTYVLSPSMLTWEYTGSETPWECKWTCLPWYQVNSQLNWCDEVLNTHTVSIWVSPEWYGSVDRSSLTGNYWASISTSGNELMIWKTLVTATPTQATDQYTYEFSWWNNSCWNTLESDCSITAEFKRSVNKYLITWKNWDGAVLDSWMVEYGTTPVYNWVNPPVRPADASNTYTFNGWSPVVTWVTQAQVYTAVYISSANTHTVSFSVDPVWYWSVDKNEIVANSWAEIEWIWDTITIWGETVTATPMSWDEQYTYEFSWWNLDDCGNILTSSCTIVAEFRRVKNIKLNIVSNNSEYWNVDVSSGYFYPGTLSLFTSGNELRVLKATIWPTKTLLTSIASPSASDEYYSYRFVDWSIPDSCSGQYNFNDDCTVVANFERLANKYMITFVNYDWTVLQQSEMEYGSKPKYMWEIPEKLVEWYTNTFRWWNPEINSTTIVEGAQVYTATFTSVANNYTVLFSWNGAVWNMPWQSFIYWVSQKLSKNSFVMDWYKFIWWNTESNWSWTWYADEESVKNLATSWVITLYAQWWVNTYVVVFSWNNNTSWSTSNQDMELWESENLNENNFVRDWYTFSWRNTQEDWNWKWYSDEELVNNLASSAWEIVTLFAQWTPNPYTIAFNGNWASTWVMESQSMVYDVERILNENKFVREWYSFKWWNTKSDWTWKPYADKALVKNLVTSGAITLYAQWWTKNSWWDSSWWWGWGLKKDYCPDGDFSWDFYDKKCWTKVTTWKIEDKVDVKPVVVTPVKTETVTKKCSIEWSKHSAEVNRAYVWACENWIIKSNTIQGAKLWEYLNRAEMAKIVTVFEMLVLDAKPNRNKDCSAFADSISWYNSEMKNYMITSCQLERMWIHTADHKPIKDFMPKKFVSRAEFWTILSRILWWNKHEASKNTSKYYVEHLTSLKWDWILTNINPELKERRSYAILMVYRAAKLLGKA